MTNRLVCARIHRHVDLSLCPTSGPTQKESYCEYCDQFLSAQERNAFFSLVTPDLTDVLPVDTEGVKQPLGTPTYGFNFVNMNLVAQMKVVVYKFELRGDQYFLSLTFSDSAKKAAVGYKPYLKLLTHVAGEQNRWQTAIYTMPDGNIRIASRERMNATRKDGTTRETVEPVFL